MTKKDMAKFKRNLKLTETEMTIYNIGIYYIDSDKEILSKTTKGFCLQENMNEGFAPNKNEWNLTEEQILIDMCKKVIGGQIGKTLVEYPVSTENEIVNQIANLGTMSISSKIDTFVESFIKKYAGNEENSYALILLSGSLIPLAKSSSGVKTTDEDLNANNEELPFIIGAVCDLKSKCLGMYFKDGILDNDRTQVKILSAPNVGFMYPTYSDDINTENIMIYAKKTGYRALFNAALDLEDKASFEMQKSAFNEVLEESSENGYAADFETVKNINENFCSYIVEKNALNKETDITYSDIEDILVKSGVNKDKLNNCKDIIENINIDAVNCIDSKAFNIEFGKTKISTTQEDAKKITSKIIDGKPCIVIEADKYVFINDINTKIY